MTSRERAAQEYERARVELLEALRDPKATRRMREAVRRVARALREERDRG